MSLEAKVEALTAALDRLAEVISGAQAIATAGAVGSNKAFPHSDSDDRTVQQVADEIEATNVAAAEKAAKAAKAEKAAKAKADKAAKEDPKPEPEVAATPEPKDEDAAADDKPEGITLQDVIDITLALGKAGKRPELVELLGKYEVAKSSQLHKNDYAGFHKRATAILEG